VGLRHSQTTLTAISDSTTVYDDAANSALEIDYDGIIVAPTFTLQSTPSGGRRRWVWTADEPLPYAIVVRHAVKRSLYF
jgi:hypothetical protein